MIIVVLILLLMNPCWAGDWDDNDEDMQAAIEASLRESQPQSQVGSDRYPLSTSAFPSGWGERSAPKVSQNYTIQNIFDKARGAGTESEYWQGLQTVAPAIKLAGYMDFLDRRDKSKFEKLFKDPDPAEWATLYGKLGLGKRTANNVFLLLDEVKGAFYKAFIRADSKTKYNLSINDAMLSLISGKWGFSKCRDVGVMGQLKDSAKRIGRTECEEGHNSDQFAAKIFGAFGKGKLQDAIANQDHRRHRLSAFAYMANGYWNGGQNDLTSFVSAATPKFQAADLKGHPLKDFIENPLETLKKPLVVKASETALTKLVFDLNNVPKGFEGFLKTFDLDDVDYSENQENLATLQAGLQGKTKQQAEQMVDDLMKGGFLKKPEGRDDQLNLKSILVESGQYQGTKTDYAYRDCLPNEPKKRSTSILNAGLENWISEYIQNIHKEFYGKREAFVVIYEGYIGRKLVPGNSEVTRQESEIAGDQTALKAMADDLKARFFPNVPAGQEVILELGVPSAARLCLYEEEIKIKGIVKQKRKLLQAIPISELDLRNIRDVANRLNADPNAQPAAVEKKDVKADRPVDLSYAVFGGPGVNQDQKIQAWGRAIDYLIQQRKIDRSLKLPILLYCLGYF